MAQWPDDPCPTGATMRSTSPTRISVAQNLRRSVRSGLEQRFGLSLNWESLPREQADPILLFAESQRGQFGEFEVSLPGSSRNSRINPAPTGTILVRTAAQAGATAIQLKGYVGAQPAVKSGDYLRFGGHTKLYRIVADKPSDAFGYANITIFPQLYAAIAVDEPVITQNLTMYAALAGDIVEHTIKPKMLYSYSAEFMEVLPQSVTTLSTDGVNPDGTLIMPDGDSAAGTIGGESAVVWLCAEVTGDVNNYAITCDAAATAILYQRYGGAVIQTVSLSANTDTRFTASTADCLPATTQGDGSRQFLIKLNAIGVTTVTLNTVVGSVGSSVRSAYRSIRVANAAITTMACSSLVTVRDFWWFGACNLTSKASLLTTLRKLDQIYLDTQHLTASNTSVFNDCGAAAIWFKTLSSAVLATTFNSCISVSAITLNAVNVAIASTSTFGTTATSAPRALRILLCPGLRVGFNLNYTSMQATALNNLFNSLGTAIPGQNTINIANNPGTATCNTSLATAKGFVVVTV
jgi:hypothetical protein